MDEKSTRNSEKVNNVEVDMIERSIQMKEGAKTKIQDKAVSSRASFPYSIPYCHPIRMLYFF